METTARTAWLPRNFRSSQLSVTTHSCHELVIPPQEVVDASARIAWRSRNFRSSQVSVGSVDSVSTGRRQQSSLMFEAGLHKAGSSGGQRKDSSLSTRGRCCLCKVQTFLRTLLVRVLRSRMCFRVNDCVNVNVLMLVALISAHSRMTDSSAERHVG